MTEKNTKKRLALLPIAAFFFANPHVSAIDVLPDFVGVLMLIYMFAPLAHLSPYMQTALKSFKKAAVYTFLRIPATALLIFLYVKYPIQTTLFPVFSLSFLVLDCIFVIPPFFHLCHAFENCDEEHRLFGKGFSKALSAFSHQCPFILALRGLLPFLPDLLLLTDDSAGKSLVGFYPFAAIFALLPSLILAYLFFVSLRALKPFLLDASDELDRLVAPYKELMSREKKVSLIRFGWLLVLLFALCQADIHLNSIDFAPDALIPVFVILALFFFGRAGALPRPMQKKAALYSLILFLPALASDIAYPLFFGTYDWRDIYYSAKAEGLYIVVLAIFACKIIIELLLLYALYRPLLHMATEETGSYIDNSPIRRQEEKNRRSLARIIRIFCISGAVGALLELANMLCSLFPIAYPADKNHVSGGETVLPALDFLGTLLTALMLLRFAYMIFSYFRIMEETRAKYKVDDFEK